MSERVRVVEGLGEVAPGPGLSALLAGLDLARLNGHDLVEVLAAQWRQVSFEQGRFLAMVAEVAHCPPGGVDGPVRRGGVQEFASEEIRFALGWTGRAADHYLNLALRLTEELPAVHEAMLAGRVDLPRAQVIADETVICPDDDARAVADQVLPAAGEQTTGQLRNKIRRLVLKQNPDAATARRDRSVAGRRVFRLLDGDGTASLSGVQMPIGPTAAAWERINRIAWTTKRTGDERTIGQLRADTMLGLILGDPVYVNHTVDGDCGPVTDNGPATDTGSGSGANGAEPEGNAESGGNAEPRSNAEAEGNPNAEAGSNAGPEGNAEPRSNAEAEGNPNPEAGSDAGPEGNAEPGGDAEAERDAGPEATGEAEGGGGAGPEANDPEGPRWRGGIELTVGLTTLMGLAEDPGLLHGWGPIVADTARQLADALRDGTWRVSVYDETTKELLHHGSTRRRPPAKIAAFVKARDQTCRAPGCGIQATHTDLDHTQDWYHGGPTIPNNLGALCRPHHRYKHESGATLEQIGPGIFRWTTALGHTYLVEPDIDDP